MQPPEEHDPQSQLHLEREWRFERNSKVRREAAKQQARTGKVLSLAALPSNLLTKLTVSRGITHYVFNVSLDMKRVSA